MVSYLEAEDLRLAERERVAVDLDETLAFLLSSQHPPFSKNQCDKIKSDVFSKMYPRIPFSSFGFSAFHFHNPIRPSNRQSLDLKKKKKKKRNIVITKDNISYLAVGDSGSYQIFS